MRAKKSKVETKAQGMMPLSIILPRALWTRVRSAHPLVGKTAREFVISALESELLRVPTGVTEGKR